MFLDLEGAQPKTQSPDSSRDAILHKLYLVQDQSVLDLRSRWHFVRCPSVEGPDLDGPMYAASS